MARMKKPIARAVLRIGPIDAGRKDNASGFSGPSVVLSPMPFHTMGPGRRVTNSIVNPYSVPPATVNMRQRGDRKCPSGKSMGKRTKSATTSCRLPPVYEPWDNLAGRQGNRITAGVDLRWMDDAKCTDHQRQPADVVARMVIEDDHAQRGKKELGGQDHKVGHHVPPGCRSKAHLRSRRLSGKR